MMQSLVSLKKQHAVNPDGYVFLFAFTPEDP